MKNYLLNVTFYAGTDEAEDTDKGVFLLSVDKEYSESEMKDIFRIVNSLLDTFNENDEALEFPMSYDDGLNLNTLMNGVEIYTKGKVMEVYNNFGKIEKIDNCYVIEQWQ